MSHCPYCSLGVSHSAGEVYCSRQMADFDRLENGIFLINGKSVYSEPHYSRFALRFIINGRMDFTIDRNTYHINSPGVLLFGQDISYTLDIPEQPRETSHVGIAFKPSFLKSAASTLYYDDNSLLDHPEENTAMPLSDLRHWPLSAKASALRDRLQAHALQPVEGNADDIACDVLQWYMEEYARYKNLLPKFNAAAARTSTKHELLRRIDAAREIIEYSEEPSGLTVNGVAKMAGFSEFHFIRTYRLAFGKSPYQHILHKKMEQAHGLLKSSPLSIGDVALSSGYDNHAAFSRAFRMHYGCSPLNVKSGK